MEDSSLVLGLFTGGAGVELLEARRRKELGEACEILSLSKAYLNFSCSAVPDGTWLAIAN